MEIWMRKTFVGHIYFTFTGISLKLNQNYWGVTVNACTISSMFYCSHLHENGWWHWNALRADQSVWLLNGVSIHSTSMILRSTAVMDCGGRRCLIQYRSKVHHFYCLMHCSHNTLSAHYFHLPWIRFNTKQYDSSEHLKQTRKIQPTCWF